jgi:ElaB/YqjD/DUF883 family membrane-anchored ribosome-binding protein
MEARLDESATESRSLGGQKFMEEMKTMFQRAEEKAVERAKAADRVVRDHPYQAIGLAFAVGLLIGVLVRRK